MYSWNKRAILGCAALSLALFACSNENSDAATSVAVQEPELEDNSAKVGIVENLNSAHVDGRAASLKDFNGGQERMYHYYELASKVRLYELDSVTLDTTGTMWRGYVLDTNGNFSFDSIPLSSPYVMIEAVPAEDSEVNINARAIIDVRKTSSVSVNLLTYMESFRLRYLVQSGMPFDSAKTQAKREVLDAFGFYDEPLDYEKKDDPSIQEYLDFTGWLVYRILRDSVLTEFSQSGSLKECETLKDHDGWPMKSHISWVANIVHSNAYKLDIPYEYYEAIGRTEYYQYAKSQVNHATNFFSALLGLGKCTADLNGTYADVQDGYFRIQCDGNRWSIVLNGHKQIDHSEGTMTDDRDGKTYKTVTYNIAGSPKTWMIENLDYGNSERKEWCLDLKPENPNFNSHRWNNIRLADSSGCGIYGGLYRAYDALMLDTTMLAENAMDSCVANNSAITDTAEMMESCYYTSLNKAKISQWADSVENANGYIQGICPDGWHIPTTEEWSALMSYLEGAYTYESILGDPSGFGLNAIGQISNGSGFIEKNSEVYFASKPGLVAAYQNQIWSWSRKMDNPLIGYGIDVLISFVRCVKN